MGIMDKMMEFMMGKMMEKFFAELTPEAKQSQPLPCTFDFRKAGIGVFR